MTAGTSGGWLFGWAWKVVPRVPAYSRLAYLGVRSGHDWGWIAGDWFPGGRRFGFSSVDKKRIHKTFGLQDLNSPVKSLCLGWFAKSPCEERRSFDVVGWKRERFGRTLGTFSHLVVWRVERLGHVIVSWNFLWKKSCPRGHGQIMNISTSGASSNQNTRSSIMIVVRQSVHEAPLHWLWWRLQNTEIEYWGNLASCQRYPDGTTVGGTVGTVGSCGVEVALAVRPLEGASESCVLRHFLKESDATRSRAECFQWE